MYLLHAQTAMYDSKVKLFLKQGISSQLGRDVVVSKALYHNIRVIPVLDRIYNATFPASDLYTQRFQSGPVPGTFTRLRSCIVPAEITEPPQN
jgi:hypothetical protein